MTILAISIRFFLGALIPIGWLLSNNLLSSQHFYYLILNLTAFSSSVIFLLVMGSRAARDIHLWIIFILLKLGYFLTFYILCFMKLRYETFASYLDATYPTEIDLLNSTPLIISYFETVTAALVAFTILVTIFKLISQLVSSKSKKNYLTEKNDLGIKLKNSSLNYLLFGTIVFSIFMLMIQVEFGLGLVSGADRQVVQLPYRLNGIIMSTIIGFIPLIFGGILWLAQNAKATKVQNQTIASFIIYGAISGLISTSKEPLIISIVMLIVLWLVTGTFTKKRFWLLLLLTPFVAIYNTFLAVNRMLRSLYEDLGIFEIFFIVIQAGVANSYDLDIIASEFSMSGLSIFLSPLMRIDASAPLLGIINYGPASDLHRFLSIMFTSELPVNALFTIEVLGVQLREGVAFIPSLLGYFLFLFGNLSFVCIGISLYTIIWHIIFRIINSLHFRLKPILTALMIITLARFTISGTLEAMPQSIVMVFIFCTIGEFLLRIIAGRGSKKINPLSAPNQSISEL